MESVKALSRFSESLETSVDRIEDVLATCTSSSNRSATNEDEQLSSFFSRLEELEETLVFCERLYRGNGNVYKGSNARTPAIKEIVELANRKAMITKRLVAAIAKEKEFVEMEPQDGAEDEEYEEEEFVRENHGEVFRDDREQEPGSKFENMGCQTPLPTPSRPKKRSGAIPTHVANDLDSDPPTPTLEAFGLSDDRVYQFEEQDEAFARESRRRFDDTFVVEQDLDLLPTHLQSQVDADLLNNVLRTVSEGFGSRSFSLDELEEIYEDGACMVLISILMQLGRVKQVGTNEFKIA